MNDRERAAKMRSEGKMTESATQKAQRRAAERSSRRSRREPDTEPSADEMGTMRRLIGAPRDAESRARGRASRASASDGSGGESYADRSARSTTGWFRRGGK